MLPDWTDYRIELAPRTTSRPVGDGWSSTLEGRYLCPEGSPALSDFAWMNNAVIEVDGAKVVVHYRGLDYRGEGGRIIEIPADSAPAVLLQSVLESEQRRRDTDSHLARHLPTPSEPVQVHYTRAVDGGDPIWSGVFGATGEGLAANPGFVTPDYIRSRLTMPLDPTSADEGQVITVTAIVLEWRDGQIERTDHTWQVTAVGRPWGLYQVATASGVQQSTLRSYLARDQMPQPDYPPMPHAYGRSGPLWLDSTMTAWLRGRGVTDETIDRINRW